MTVHRITRTHVDCFNRAQAFTTTPGQNGWTSTLTGTTPTSLCITENGGAAKLTLTATSEAQVAALHFNDVLPYDVRFIHNFYCICKVAGVDAVSVVTMGLGSANLADEDTVATNCWFKMEGATSTTAVVVETDDATTDNNDKATGETLAAVYKKFNISFANKGITNIQFDIDGEPVARSTTFSMNDLGAGLNVQPYFQVTKASGTGTPSLTIAEVGICYEHSYGA